MKRILNGVPHGLRTAFSPFFTAEFCQRPDKIYLFAGIGAGIPYLSINEGLTRGLTAQKRRFIKEFEDRGADPLAA